ncbi:NAD(P)-binding protein [Stipitochalara longipes BDJ]|nr:NAD(P)-binding protein [Stipitochalara longipes BDJ]
MSRRVLLTGANGFLGTHILFELLNKGFFVRSIVRSQSKADQIAHVFPSFASQMDFGIVPDMTIPGAFDQVVKSSPPFDAVLHQASPFFFSAIGDNSEFLDPAIKGTTEILKAVKAHAPEVKRVIYTCSCAAVLDFSAPVGTTPRKVYTEEDWYPITISEALAGTKADAYRASKKFAELAAWDFVKNEKPNFDLVSLNPPMIYGPLKHTVSKIGDVNESNARLYNNFINSKKDAPLPPNGVHMYVDVRDLAIAHVKAITTPEAGGQRIIVSSKEISSQQISDILRKNFTELEERTPIGKPGTDSLPEGAYTVSNEKAKKLLGLEFRSDEECFVELGGQLLEIEKASA